MCKYLQIASITVGWIHDVKIIAYNTDAFFDILAGEAGFSKSWE